MYEVGYLETADVSQTRCGICLCVGNNNEMVDLYGSSFEIVEGEFKLLREAFQEITQIDIAEITEFTSSICKLCLIRLKEASRFRRQACCTQQKILQILQKADKARFESNFLHIVSAITKDEEDEQSILSSQSMEAEFLDWHSLEDRANTLKKGSESGLEGIVYENVLNLEGEDEVGDDNLEDVSSSDVGIKEAINNDDIHCQKTPDVTNSEENVPLGPLESGEAVFELTFNIEESTVVAEQDENCNRVQIPPSDDALPIKLEIRQDTETQDSTYDATNKEKVKLPNNKLSSRLKQRECEYCRKVFHKKSNYISHLRIHTNYKPYLCQYCSKEFTQIGNFNAHLRTHTQERPFTCPICSKSFARSDNCKLHMRIHSNFRPYNCEICSKSFTHSTSFKVHAHSHTEKSPYVCHICSKGYNFLTSFKIHMATHTNERKHICPTCNKSFTTSTNLATHRRSHDPTLRIKCDYCAKTFTLKSNYKTHLRKKHSEKLC